MAVASHLHIRLEEYDDRIVTFVPGYHALVANAARAVGTLAVASPHIVDLGTGSGALAARCLAECPQARLTAIDEDPEILTLAMARLKDRTAATFIQGSFTSVPLPPCDAFVASLSLHHIRAADVKRAFYARCRDALPAGGLLVTADCCPATDERLRTAQFAAWRAHLERTYSEREAAEFLAAWAVEDVYFPLDEERAMLGDAGFTTEVVWREGAMAVVVATRES